MSQCASFCMSYLNVAFQAAPAPTEEAPKDAPTTETAAPAEPAPAEETPAAEPVKETYVSLSKDDLHVILMLELYQ